jgi:hypothetical protein
MSENEHVESTQEPNEGDLSILPVPTYATRIPAEAFGGTVPDDDALRFYRLIDERTTRNGVEEIELACGHTLVFVPPLPKTQEYASCPKCIAKWGCR